MFLFQNMYKITYIDQFFLPMESHHIFLKLSISLNLKFQITKTEAPVVINLFSKKYIYLTHFQPMGKPWLLLAKCVKKHLSKSDTLSKNQVNDLNLNLEDHSCRGAFSHILLVQTKYLLSSYVEHWLEMV